MTIPETISTIGGIIGILCSITVLVTFTRNSNRNSEEATKKNVLQEQAILNLGTTITRYQEETTQRFDKIEGGLKELTETVQKRDFEFAKLQWEHNQCLCEAKKKEA